MSREEVFTIRCNRCGKKITFGGEGLPPEELKEWQTLEVRSLMGEGKAERNALMIFFGGKNFDLCKECYLKFKETFLSILPPEILKAFEEKPEDNKSKEGDEPGEHKETGNPGTDQ
jgi:hypothetical protein